MAINSANRPCCREDSKSIFYRMFLNTTIACIYNFFFLIPESHSKNNSGYLDNYFKEESNCFVKTEAGAEKNLLADCN